MDKFCFILNLLSNYIFFKLIFQKKIMKNSELLNLVEKYKAPLYVYDIGVMSDKLDKIRKAFSGIDELQIYYACKALSNINILKFFKGSNTGLDVVSIQEVMLGVRAGFASDAISFTPNGVSIEEIDKAVEMGVKINIDNLYLLNEFGKKYSNIPICIRINPHIMTGGNSKISVGHIDSKFGISTHYIQEVKEVVGRYGIRVEGVHMHTGSDILNIDAFLKGIEVLLEVVTKFDELEYINLGSGFKVAYKPNDVITDMDLLGNKLTKRLQEFFVSYGKKLTVVFEPGKFLVSESGVFLTRVNSIKPTPTAIFVHLDTGFNHLIRPMYYDAYHDVENISNQGKSKEIYNLVGYICETDTFATNRLLSEVSVGDVLAFKNAGAYCFSMASNYNSRYRPAEVMIYNGKDYLIRQRENFEDLLKKQIDVL